MKTIEDLGELAGRRVLVRSDLNVPMNKSGDGDSVIGDDGRIRASLPTLVKLAKAGAKVIVVAHLGRPKGKPNPEFTLAPVAKRLGELLGVEVTHPNDTVGDAAKAAVEAMGDGDVVLLEGRDLMSLTVLNTGDRPVQVGSHFHFAEANEALQFDREAAVGSRLAVPAGTSVRFEPGISMEVELVAFAGDAVTAGFRGLYSTGQDS